MVSSIALFIFKRPDTTKRVFEEIRKAKPKNLFIISDYPRNEEEKIKSEETKKIVENVDWNCNVRRNYADYNMGCADRITSGVNWVFEHVNEAIFLEDDCLPDPTFFRFCEEMLDTYRDDSRIMMVSGNNFQNGRKRTKYSYYYSKIFHIWGWATWKRAWQYYDHDIKIWSVLDEENWLDDIIIEPRSILFYRFIYHNNYHKHINDWDFKWNLCCWAQNGLSIMPNHNLVSNIGFGKDATHAFNPDDELACIPAFPMEFPLKSPPYVIQDRKADLDTMRKQFSV